jgi:hypothetical protein
MQNPLQLLSIPLVLAAALLLGWSALLAAPPANDTGVSNTIPAGVSTNLPYGASTNSPSGVTTNLPHGVSNKP